MHNDIYHNDSVWTSEPPHDTVRRYMIPNSVWLRQRSHRNSKSFMMMEYLSYNIALKKWSLRFLHLHFMSRFVHPARQSLCDSFKLVSRSLSSRIQFHRETAPCIAWISSAKPHLWSHLDSLLHDLCARHPWVQFMCRPNTQFYVVSLVKMFYEYTVENTWYEQV